GTTWRTERAGNGTAAVASSAAAARQSTGILMALTILILVVASRGGRSSRLHDGQGVAGAVLGDGAGARERKVIAADHDLVGDHAIEQRAARGLGHHTVLVVLAVPAPVGDHQRPAVGGLVRNPD